MTTRQYLAHLRAALRTTGAATAQAAAARIRDLEAGNTALRERIAELENDLAGAAADAAQTALYYESTRADAFTQTPHGVIPRAVSLLYLIADREPAEARHLALSLIADLKCRDAQRRRRATADALDAAIRKGRLAGESWLGEQTLAWIRDVRDRGGA
jgi:hypothetical protein